MKKLLTLALCLCLALGGCARTAEPAPEPSPAPTEGDVLPEPSPAPVEAVGFERLALSLAELPELPEEPDIEAFNNAISDLDFGTLGQEGYQKEYDRLWSAYSEQSDAYDAALRALRGEGVDDALTPALAAYTLRTAQQLMADETEENVVCSPANSYLALCMLAETTDGESRAQLLDLLGLSSVEQARSAANALWRTLYRDSSAGKTLLANSLWLNERFSYHEDTVDTLARDYYASTFCAPMGDKATDDAIHAWINENTNHLLEDAANGLETKDDTLMALISTLYFKGTWTSPFNAYDTREDTFTTAGGAEQRIDFMHSVKNGAYFRGEHCTVASLPFQDGTAMWFLLPDEGFAPSVEALNQTVTAMQLGVSQRMGEIHWSVPKFDVSSTPDLIPTLQALGVTDIFLDGVADFSPLTDMDAIVTAVGHAARVKVDEEGCEAAAFTTVMAEATSGLIDPLPVVQMNLNRPFGFLITGVTGLPLFAGLVNTVA